MFGRDWQDAEATIVDRRLIDKGHSGEGGDLTFEVYEYIADVRPDDSILPFRATLKEPFNGLHFKSPAVGQVVRVKFREKDHKVKFDHDDPGTHRDLTHRRQDDAEVAAAQAPEEQARWEALASGAPGSAPATAAPPAMPNEASADSPAAALPPAAPGAMDALAAIMKAKEAGDQAEVEHLKEDWKNQAGGV